MKRTILFLLALMVLIGLWFFLFHLDLVIPKHHLTEWYYFVPFLLILFFVCILSIVFMVIIICVTGDCYDTWRAKLRENGESQPTG